MPYVQGQGFQMGLRLAEAQAQYEREQAYMADRVKAERQAQADSEAAGLQLDRIQQDALAAAPGALPTGAAGPVSPQVDAIQRQFARVRDVALRMSPENRGRFIEEQKAAMRERVVDQARQKVAEGLQDRVARGGFNFLDEKEPNPAIDARIQQLAQALDSKQIDPLQASELEAKILEAVRAENERRLEHRRGTAMVEQELKRAVDSGNVSLAADLESLSAAWGTRELKIDDLVDKVFEAKYGRKTARAAGPTEFDLRKEAVQLWTTYEKGPPTEEGLRRYMDLLSPPGRAGQPIGRQAVLDAVSGNAGGRGAEGLTGAAPPTAPPQAASPALAEQQGPPEAGGLPPRPWSKLKPDERAAAEKEMLATAAKGGDLGKLLKAIGITDPDALPASLKKRLLQLAKKASVGTAFDGPLRGH